MKFGSRIDDHFALTRQRDAPLQTRRMPYFWRKAQRNPIQPSFSGSLDYRNNHNNMGMQLHFLHATRPWPTYYPRRIGWLNMFAPLYNFWAFNDKAPLGYGPWLGEDTSAYGGPNSMVEGWYDELPKRW
jgi:hypothetical protein